MEQLTLNDQMGALGEVTDEAPTTESLGGLVFANGRAEEEILQDLLERAVKVTEERESKVLAILALLHHRLADPQEKVIIFTEFRDTLDLLERILTLKGYGPMIVTYHGATPPAARDRNRRAFLSNPNTRVFLATDAASEGINLHKSCNTLIHVEIPWNPNRYEQRNGRIDRYGQQSQPNIFLLVASRSVEQRMAQVVVEKLERIDRELGSVSNVFPLAQKIKIEDFMNRLDTERLARSEQALADDALINPEVEQAAAEVERLLDEAQETEMQELAASLPAELIKGERFGHQERLALQQRLEASREFVPEYRDVEDFLHIFITLPEMDGGRIYRTREEDIWTIEVPPRLQRELKDAQGHTIENYPRATFQRLLAIKEAEREVEQRVEFLSPGHPLVQAALRYMRGRAFDPGFPSRIAYRRTAIGSTPGYIFTYAVRFVDGRGETIEERFEAVFVALDGSISQHAEEDVRMFTERRAFGNLSLEEESSLLPHFQAAFETAKSAAAQEMERRRDARSTELRERQRDISDKALMRLGVWKNASEEQLRRRFPDISGYGRGGQMQLDLTGEQRRRETLFQREQDKLASRERERRLDIRAMESVRGEAIDAIGALVLIPEGMHM